MDETRRRFEAVVLPHMDAAYNFARWLCPSSADAEDVVQEALLRALRGFGALRGGDVKAWLFTIVRNCHFSALRSRGRRAQLPLPEEPQGEELEAFTASGADPQAESIRADQARSLDELMRSLPEEYREVLLLREVEDLSYREIAAVIAAPIGTVMSRLARARAALRARWLERIEEVPHAVP
jgi:RNA polymerase sigma-70 factor (ECF subfamily)